MKSVELKSITKRFGSVIANDNISFGLEQGEIHAILGENGAGKSTLMNILSGLYQPDSGDISVRGQPVQFRSPKDAINMGIGMIHQHFMLIQSNIVLDNIILGTRLPIFLIRKNLVGKISDFCQHLNFQIDLNARIWQLSTGEQQRVEIVKALYHGAKILVLDEPTAILTPQESENLLQVLSGMRDEGYAIIIVSHKLDEVLSIADKITILRRGKLVDTLPNQNVQKAELARMMVGRDVILDTGHRQGTDSGSELALQMNNVVARSNRRLIALDNVSLELHSGEILGVAGVAGNGQSELAEVLTGLRNVESGSINIFGEETTKMSVKDIIQLGVAYIPEDRVNVGSIGTLNVNDNILLRCYDLFSFLNKAEISGFSEELVRKYDVACSNLSKPVRYLSGGNLQKLILARELREAPKLLIATYPSRGLDVGAIEYVRNVLMECRKSGSAILLISEDLDGLLSLSDRIAVMYEGKFTSIPTRDRQEIGLAMARVI